ncbi:hypothetical protein [Paracoccus sp. (in: a-proteobacteria)]|uniref:hypothetical protein n=1 Tax=Paracoccus sp. TaxID=267 RepID=UPI0032208D46
MANKDPKLIRTLQKRAEQVAFATEIIVSETRDWQMIKQFMQNRLKSTQLSPLQQDKLNRYQYIYNQLASGKYTEQHVIGQLTELYGIEYSQACADLRATQELFTNVLNINKVFEIKMELQAARSMRNKCTEIHDFKAAAAIQKNIVQLLKELKDAEPQGADLFEGITIEASFDPSLLGVAQITNVELKDLMKEINSKRAKKIKLDFIEDIDCEIL